MSWIQHPVVLEGNIVKLAPLEREHFADLIAIGRQAEIWTHLPFDGTDARKLEQELQSALLKRINGEQYPFTIIRRSSGKITGSTRLFEIFPEHRKLEIGWTWNDPESWGTGTNTEAKLLLLTYCFETLGAQRVQLKTRDTNVRSRAAILKIGAKFEGVLRKDRLGKDGHPRDSYMFSIIDDEWPEVKEMLTNKLHPENINE
jgi:N-acetyltransferase